MNAARHRYLAYNNAPAVKVVGREEQPGGSTILRLECGHEGHLVAHFDARCAHDWRCFECGMELVRTSPRWAHEWKE